MSFFRLSWNPLPSSGAPAGADIESEPAAGSKPITLQYIPFRPRIQEEIEKKSIKKWEAGPLPFSQPGRGPARTNVRSREQEKD